MASPCVSSGGSHARRPPCGPPICRLAARRVDPWSPWPLPFLLAYERVSKAVPRHTNIPSITARDRNERTSVVCPSLPRVLGRPTIWLSAVLRPRRQGDRPARACRPHARRRTPRCNPERRTTWTQDPDLDAARPDADVIVLVDAPRPQVSSSSTELWRTALIRRSRPGSASCRRHCPERSRVRSRKARGSPGAARRLRRQRSPGRLHGLDLWRG